MLTIAVKLPQSIDAAIRQSFKTNQERGAWLRQVLVEAAQRKFMQQSEVVPED